MGMKDYYSEDLDAWDSHDSFQARNLAPQVERILQPAIDRGEADLIRSKIDRVIPGVYSRIRGPYGRGDVRRAIYLVLSREAN